LRLLNALMEKGNCFAACRLPGDDSIHVVWQEGNSERLFYAIEELNRQSGFVIAPFSITGNCPGVLFRPDKEEVFSIPPEVDATFPDKLSDRPAQTVPPTDEYSTRFATFIAPIREKRFKKLVLSRSLTVERDESFSAAEAFLLACRRYIRSYVYLCHTPQTGTWLGGTPEILLSGEGNRWRTVALAGTQQLVQGNLPHSWDDKNLIEQMLVAYYIRTQLASFGIDAEEKEPYTVRAGELAHLRTDFYFSLPDTGQLGKLLQLLHPTPAVSGLPKDEAYSFIVANEGYDRRYYSGFIGQLNLQGKSNLYVNLRCMNIQARTLTLYAGGGLLPSSTLADEWQETEDKLQTMLFITKIKNYVL
jgi:isochorismate synthase